MDFFTDALGKGENNNKRIANMILFNQQAIAGRAFAETQTNYPTTNLTIDFANDVVKSIRYDLVTSGNAGAFRLTQNWFDGEGNFIAFENVTRTHLLFCLARIREYSKSVLFDFAETGWDIKELYLE